MIRVRQIGDRTNRTFTVKNPKKIKFWKFMAKQGTAKGIVFTEILWEKEDKK